MEELAKLLGTTKEKLETLTEEMGDFTGKKDVPSRLLEIVKAERARALDELGLSENSPREKVLEALASRVELIEEEIKKVLGDPDIQNHEDITRLFERAFEIAKPKKGFFLKEEKARELFRKNPPKNILAQAGYESVEEMFKNEDLREVYSAIRFLEDRKWQNEVFFAPASDFTPEDFEEREIVARILDPKKWGSEALNFTKKKFHNTTHLKELGVVILIPVEYTEGALTRLFSMMFHYLNEVSFYAKYFKLISEEPKTFAAKFISALRGDVREDAPAVENIVSWVIMQRYLAKEDPEDPRLAIPHISPEAMHWAKASSNLAKLGQDAPGLSFFAGKAHLCGFMGGELTSFNFEDNVFSLAAGEDTPQYTYHAREALWNRFFMEYFEGREDVLETLMVEDFGQGFVGFKIRDSTPMA
ncbi:hypothetical protein GTO10_01510 [Candidatus Saccharibacteria bacterium]|nr:hypothetical protein [Candidatus Saccharibacteria bacterium]